MTMGELIQTKRTQKGMSQEGLADLVGVSRQAVSKWEVGDAVPDTDKLVSLSGALGITVDELLGNIKEEKPSQGGPVPPDKSLSWFSTHWYWLGAIPALWGGYRLAAGAVVMVQLFYMLRQFESFLGAGWYGPEELSMFFNEAGGIAYGTVFGYVWPQFLIALLALLAGVLIFFLGRRRVHRMYGAK